jgi:hypothetical protein
VRKAKGIGTALKPTSEHWILIRKPISEKTVAANVLEHGTGGINIDASRIGIGELVPGGGKSKRGNGYNYNEGEAPENAQPGTNERFPANLVLSHNDDCEGIECKVKWYDQRDGQGIAYAYDGTEYYIDESSILEPIKSGDSVYLEVNTSITEIPCGMKVRLKACTPGCAVAALDAQSGESKSPKTYVRNSDSENANSYGKGMGEKAGKESINFGDSGGASRFFYCAKASKKDKGLDNTHPTVKSSTLMSYLIKMITPPMGTVLDPFMGSGSTGVSSIREGYSFIGIEKETEYLEISKKRIGVA